MKKVLLIGLILAICILAMPQGVSADTAQINAAVVESVTFSAAGSNVTTWNLNYFSPGPVNTVTDGLKLAVSTNNNWHITVDGTSGGFLRPYASSAYTGTALALPLHLTNTVLVSDQTVTGSAANLVTAVGPISGWTRNYNYVQTLTVADDPRNDYQIVLNVGLVNDG